jgi:hypothetical protein
MGKSKSGRNRERKRKAADQARHSKHSNTREEEDDDDDDKELLAAAAAWAEQAEPPSNNSKTRDSAGFPKGKKLKMSPQEQRLPLAFPRQNDENKKRSLLLPASGFLRDEEPYRESFQTALDTAYEGCVWDSPNAGAGAGDTSTSVFDEDKIQWALNIMDTEGLFRTDVTQPAGLGSKCVKTYVTRCLLGEEGTTYKYLGLRMFSHTWSAAATKGGSSTNSKSPQLQSQLKEAIKIIAGLNQRLTSQTEKHLKTLEQKRIARGMDQPVIQGRAGFDITLINRMKVSPNWKEEPMFRDGNKCPVSWHADSSLEQYSTIAVYQTLVQGEDNNSNNIKATNKKQKNKHHPPHQTNMNSQDRDWSVALRVAHDTEGPKAKRLSDITVVEESPPIAVSLQSGSAYYLLDDHNHHHQHAVLAPNDVRDASVRFSSTHRLLRQGHNVQHMLARCETICSSNFDRRKGPKIWRSEQILLNEIEFEWLRQFFIQGTENKELLWDYWNEPIQRLFQYWEQLETRTRQVLLILQNAAEERCGLLLSVKDKPFLREQRTKALATIHEILGQRSPKGPIYDSFATILMERSCKREQWAKRERDPVFKRMPPGYQPIPFPVIYNGTKESSTSNEAAFGRSPMPNGSADFLSKLALHVKAWGVCYENQSANELPEGDLLAGHLDSGPKVAASELNNISR